MKFTINLVESLIIPTHRLKNNGRFEKIDENDVMMIMSDDMSFSTFEGASRWIKQNPINEIDLFDVESNQIESELAGKSLDIISHRDKKPLKPFIEKNELIGVLENGNDSVTNVLTIDWDGNIHLTPFHHLRYRDDCAVRIESFGAGNGYVGSRSALNHLDNTYTILLEAWLDHLISQQNEYRDYPASKSEEELKSEIVKVIAEFNDESK